MARPRKPTVLKLIAGKPGHRPLPAGEPVPTGELGPAPAWLSARARQFWADAVASAPPGMLTGLDWSPLAAWCVSCDRYIIAVEHIDRDGPTDVSAVTGSAMQSVWQGIKNVEQRNMLKAISELGFSPTSRARATTASANSKKPANRFAAHAPDKRRA